MLSDLNNQILASLINELNVMVQRGTDAGGSRAIIKTLEEQLGSAAAHQCIRLAREHAVKAIRDLQRTDTNEEFIDVLHTELKNANDATVMTNVAMEVLSFRKKTGGADLATLVAKIADVGDTAGASSPGEAISTQLPVLNPQLFNTPAIRGMSAMVTAATGGQVTDFSVMLKEFSNMQQVLSPFRDENGEIDISKIIKKLQRPSATTAATAPAQQVAGAPDDGLAAVQPEFAAPMIAATPTGPDYTFLKQVRSIGEIIDASCIDGDVNIKKDLLNTPIAVYTCAEDHPAIPTANKNYRFDAMLLQTLVYAMEQPENACLVGPPGCGKTTILKELAARTGRPFYRIPIDGELRRREMIGGFKQVATPRGSQTAWFNGILLDAIQQPSVVDFDEIDRADPDLLYACHTALEREPIILLEDGHRKIHVHPEAFFGATANTKGRVDANGLYAMSSEMSEATRDRLPFWIDVDYMDERSETNLLMQMVPKMTKAAAEAIAKSASILRKSFKDGDIRTTVSTRQTVKVAQYYAFLKSHAGAHAPMTAAFEKIIFGRGSDEPEAQAMRELIKMRMSLDKY